MQAVLPLRRRATGSRATRPARRRRRARKHGRNRELGVHLYNRDVISMPDNWEYPWYAAWDLAFHMLPFARGRSDLRQGAARSCCCASGTCTPTGRSRRTSSRFGDVNPPVHAWACWRVYKMTGPRGSRDRAFLERVLPEAADQLHLVGEPQGRRRATTCSPAASSGSTTSACSTAAKPLPDGGQLEQADGTAWMAFYLRHHALDGARAGAARTRRTRTSRSKFFEHFVAIVDAMNALGGSGPVGRAGRLLLRPAAWSTAQTHPAARAVAWWG